MNDLFENFVKNLEVTKRNVSWLTYYSNYLMKTLNKLLDELLEDIFKAF